MTNIRSIVIFIIIQICPMIIYCRAENPNIVLYEDSVMKICNPEYDYEIINEHGHTDCIGTFSFDITVFKDKPIIMCISANHLPEDADPIFWGLKIILDLEKGVKTTIRRDRVRWGRFLAFAYDIDGDFNIIKDSMMCSTNYISDDDKTLLYSLIDEYSNIEIEKIDVNINNNSIIINVDDSLPPYYVKGIEILNINGCSVLNYSNSSEEHCINISLADFTKGIYLIHIKTIESSIIKKIIL